MVPPDLERATDRLYAVFAHHPMPPDMTACDHCVDPAEVDLFRRTPLRALTPKQLGTYLSNPGTWGDGTELPHLVPRLLAAYASGEMADWWWPGHVTSRIHASWQHWSPEERTAVTGFVRSWWRRTLTSWPSTNPVPDVLEAVVALDLDVEEYLSDFAELPGDTPARQLAAFVDNWRWGSSLPEDAQRAVRRWLIGGTPGRVLWEAAVARAGCPAGDELTEAAELVDVLRDMLRGENA
ncbi:hypothetical protein [Micromonospora sp. MA102]|uniref:hypothetical protein n=1 Tax=Micromonospora sp. MA102 TaxID=2952755 RepID=UPI0021C9209D|nr:hypothetical protein [Micromonospora sp. MA102]